MHEVGETGESRLTIVSSGGSDANGGGAVRKERSISSESGLGSI